MTMLLGIADRDGALVAADDTCTDDDGVYPGTSKVALLGDIAIGFAGDLRLFQLLRYSLGDEPPRLPHDLDTEQTERWLSATVGETMAECVGALLERLSRTGIPDYPLSYQVVLGVQSEVYSLDRFGCLMHAARRYFASGSAGAIATGSLHASRLVDQPLVRAQDALEACAEHLPSIRGPLQFVRAPMVVTSSKRRKRDCRKATQPTVDDQRPDWLRELND